MLHVLRAAGGSGIGGLKLPADSLILQEIVPRGTTIWEFWMWVASVRDG
ncbi:hypothetical protein KNP414_07896 [Paenibacillus mucilaginosus KNP414]|uniref:Uncharacterized protein n=1 Tax=Paenibacillus mucilaginosus (strain KNP414) TaxID=1036673 RepID=F8FJ03_PAEMK|nr:hypothetical protein KNP414_07896 [Paenibacillus mucilaginosus KNP414]